MAEQGFKPYFSALMLKTITLYCPTKMRIKLKEPQREIKLWKEQPEFLQQHPLFWSTPVLKLEDLGVSQCDILGKDTYDTNPPAISFNLKASSSPRSQYSQFSIPILNISTFNPNFFQVYLSISLMTKATQFLNEKLYLLSSSPISLSSYVPKSLMVLPYS